MLVNHESHGDIVRVERSVRCKEVLPVLFESVFCIVNE